MGILELTASPVVLQVAGTSAVKISKKQPCKPGKGDSEELNHYFWCKGRSGVCMRLANTPLLYRIYEWCSRVCSIMSTAVRLVLVVECSTEVNENFPYGMELRSPPYGMRLGMYCVFTVCNGRSLLH